VVEDSFLKNAYNVSHTTFMSPTLVDTSGSVGLLCFGVTQSGASDSGGIGDGPLAQLTFKVKSSTGSSVIDVTQNDTTVNAANYQSMLLDTLLMDFPFVCQDGFYGEEIITPTSSKGISIASGNQTRPAVAWKSSATYEFLVAWEEYTTATGNSDIKARRTNSTGDTVGSVINIEGSLVLCSYSPSLCWNGTRYLAAFVRQGLGGFIYDIYGDTISAGGGVGSAFVICNAARYQGNPAIAWNGTYHLVVWQDARNTSQFPQIYGQRLDVFGALTGSNFYISPSDGYYHGFPRVASNGSEFLTVWVDNSSSGNSYGRIRGQRIGLDGTLLGSVIAVASAGSYPDIAWDGTNYLIVYQRPTATVRWDIYGQRISSTGSLVGTEFAINTAANDQTLPRVIYDPQSGRYAVVWVSEQSTPAIYKQIVNTNGSLFGSPAIQANANYHQIYPALANGIDNDMVVWADFRSGTSFDIYGDNPTIIGVDEKDESGYKTDHLTLEVCPNPFSDKITIRYMIHDARCRIHDLRIFDADGRLMKQFNHLTIQPFNQVVWDGTGNLGYAVSPGVYFVVLNTNGQTVTEKVILTR
jgi:hypothetical protein